jgi:NDP-sugar pyrophosphorylase family protein
MSAPVTAVVLVGGLGTRLRTLYPDRPKALVPVLGRPFIAWLVAWLRHHGIGRVHLAAGYRADQLATWRSGQPEDAALTVTQEPRPLGTAGGLRFAAAPLTGRDFLVVNGDSFLPSLDLRTWLATPLAPDLLGSLAVTPIHDAGRYGTVGFDDMGRLRAFHEKADRSGGWVNGGLYRIRRELLDRIPVGDPCSLEQDLFPRLAAEGVLGVERVNPPLLDMGTPEGLAAMESYLRAHPGFAGAGTT